MLKQHKAGSKTADLAHKHGVSEATLLSWKAKDSGIDVSEAKRLKQLKDDNTKLKKIEAGLSLDREMLEDVIRGKIGGLLASTSWRQRSVTNGRIDEARVRRPGVRSFDLQLQ